jgi:hypothetical protein
VALPVPGAESRHHPLLTLVANEVEVYVAGRPGLEAAASVVPTLPMTMAAPLEDQSLVAPEECKALIILTSFEPITRRVR